jgi:PHD/YefM family antitoxin component YafN of YafNO toxin-antitoxin module
MREFSSQDLQKKSSLVQEAALVAPIAITFRGRRRHVMMSAEEFERLSRAAAPRVYALHEIPDDLLADLAGARMEDGHESLDAEMESASASSPRRE